ncbi:MAG: hypothetical protein V8S27_02710 [Lachnospiraceae bacterium]
MAEIWWRVVLVFGKWRDGGRRKCGDQRRDLLFLYQRTYGENQYLGLEFFGDDGQHQSDGDIRTIGNADVTTEQKDLITDALYLVPAGGWSVL